MAQTCIKTVLSCRACTIKFRKMLMKFGATKMRFLPGVTAKIDHKCPTLNDNGTKYWEQPWRKIRISFNKLPLNYKAKT